MRVKTAKKHKKTVRNSYDFLVVYCPEQSDGATPPGFGRRDDRREHGRNRREKDREPKKAKGLRAVTRVVYCPSEARSNRRDTSGHERAIAKQGHKKSRPNDLLFW